MLQYLTERNLRRAFTLALFLGLLWFFRHLLFLFVLFVIFQRSLSAVANLSANRFGLKFKWAVLIVVAFALVVGAASLWFGVNTVVARGPAIHEQFEDVIRYVRESPRYQQYRHLGGTISTELLVEKIREHLGSVIRVAATLGREALYMVIALIFAVVF